LLKSRLQRQEADWFYRKSTTVLVPRKGFGFAKV